MTAFAAFVRSSAHGVLPDNSSDMISYNGNFIVSRIELAFGRDYTPYGFQMPNIRSDGFRNVVLEVVRLPILHFNPNDVPRRVVLSYDRPTSRILFDTPIALTGIQALDAVTRMCRRTPLYE